MFRQVILGNNIEVLKNYPDNYFDAIVTDAPYGLGKEPDAAEVLKSWVEVGYHEVKGTGFMGKEWDAFVPQPLFWKEVFRVLKHGGHVLSFFGTRTYDWGVMAMRVAGFEIRDKIDWHYGSGFPKSHNISKAIDKMSKESGRLLEFSEILRKKRMSLNLSISEADKIITGGSTMYSFLEGRKVDDGFKIYPPNKEYYEKIKELYSIDGWDDIVENNLEKIGEEKGSFGYQKRGERWESERIINKSTTEAAKLWDGWGSALKPASEPIVLARKPLEKGLSIAENVLKWGTGAINIDGCRISTNEKKEFERKKENISVSGWKETNRNEYEQNSQGRFPANLILTHHPECVCNGLKKVKSDSHHTTKYNGNETLYKGGWKDGEDLGNKFADENGEETVEDWTCHEDCPIRIMDEQSGMLKSGKPMGDKNASHGFGGGYGKIPVTGFGDSGGASRFFINTKSGGKCDFFMYIYDSINLNICGNTLENQKVVGTLNGVTMEIEKFTQSVEQFTCGNKSMELCQKDMKFIISTLTEQMIELKTYNVLKGVNIDFYMKELFKTINSLMELKIENVNLAKNINHLMNLLLEMVEHIKVIVSLVQNQNCNNGEKKIESDIINTTESIEKKSRFLYIAKASKSERNCGLKESNVHPTVKPVKLMQYLVRLITPPNGLVLDPFCGSGTTGIACKLEGFNFIGIDITEEYCKIAEARIENYVEEKDEIKLREEEQIEGQLDLFA